MYPIGQRIKFTECRYHHPHFKEVGDGNDHEEKGRRRDVTQRTGQEIFFDFHLEMWSESTEF